MYYYWNSQVAKKWTFYLIITSQVWLAIENNRRQLDIQSWFANPINTIVFVIIVFVFVVIILVILLIYKMNPKLRNWIKSCCKKKPVTVDKETLEKDWNRYVERK